MKMRFEVLVNGILLATAGLEEDGELFAVVRHRDCWRPPRTPFDALFKDHDVEDTELYASWTSYDQERGGAWLKRVLRPGDEVTIRVLGPGPIDPPGSAELLRSEDEPEIPF